MFSATGKILSGTAVRPDIMVGSVNFTNAKNQRVQQYFVDNATFNLLGQTPMVSTISGVVRVVLGTFHTLIHLFASIFSSENREKHWDEAKLGMKNITRGFVEIVPVLGNFTVYQYDKTRIERLLKSSSICMGKEPEIYQNALTIFSQGKDGLDCIISRNNAKPIEKY